MATGRTHLKYTRVYVNGYDMSGYMHTIGPLGWTADTSNQAALTDSVQSAIPGANSVTVGDINSFMDNTATSGLHVLFNNPGAALRNIMIPIGIRAAPAAGDPCFLAQVEQKSYIMDPSGVTVNVGMSFESSARHTQNTYAKPWGVLLRALAARTSASGANTGTGDHNAGGETTAGGYLMYQVTAGNGTATISIDDSTDNINFSALSGATSGEIDFSTPTSGVVALATDAHVQQYLRWQIAFNSATSVTFALAFVRG